MAKQPRISSQQIALCAISCALAVIFLALGVYSDVLLASGYFMASIALMIPLAKGYYLGGFLAYLGTCILTIVLGAVGQLWILVPFMLFFGLHPLLNALQKKFKINVALAFFIKAVWFDLTLWVYYQVVMGGFISSDTFAWVELINTFIWLFVFVGGTLVFGVYDFVVQRAQKYVSAVVCRIVK